jgi:hypothetical protein
VSELPHRLQVDPVGLRAFSCAADESAGEEVRVSGAQPQVVGILVVDGQVDFVAQPPSGFARGIPSLRAAVAVVPSVLGPVEFEVVPVENDLGLVQHIIATRNRADHFLGIDGKTGILPQLSCND